MSTTPSSDTGQPVLINDMMPFGLHNRQGTAIHAVSSAIPSGIREGSEVNANNEASGNSSEKRETVDRAQDSADEANPFSPDNHDGEHLLDDRCQRCRERDARRAREAEETIGRDRDQAWDRKNRFARAFEKMEEAVKRKVSYLTRRERYEKLG